MPLLVLKLLLFSLRVGADPGLGFEERHQNARNIIVLHHLVDDRDGKTFKVVRNEPDQAEACHCGLEIDVRDLLVQILPLRLAKHLLSGRL